MPTDIATQLTSPISNSKLTPNEFVLGDASITGNGLQPEFQNATWAQFRDAAYGVIPSR